MTLHPRLNNSSPEDLERAAFQEGYRYGVEDWMHGLFDRDNHNGSAILHGLGRYRADHLTVNGVLGVDGEVPDAVYWTLAWVRGHRAGYDAIEAKDPHATAIAHEVSGE